MTHDGEDKAIIPEFSASGMTAFGFPTGGNGGNREQNMGFSVPFVSSCSVFFLGALGVGGLVRGDDKAINPEFSESGMTAFGFPTGGGNARAEHGFLCSLCFLLFSIFSWRSLVSGGLVRGDDKAINPEFSESGMTAFLVSEHFFA